MSEETKPEKIELNLVSPDPLPAAPTKTHFTLHDLQEELNFTRAALRKLREDTGVKLRVDLERDCSQMMAEFLPEVTLYIINKSKIVTLRELIAKLNPDYQEVKILDDMQPANPNAD